MVQLAERMGLVESHEQDMVRKIFRINDISAQAIMKHRKDVFSLSKDLTIKESFTHILESGYSRIPVFENNPENIVGIVLFKDLVNTRSSRGDQVRLKEIMVEPIFISETKKADDLFFQLQKEKLNIAVVIDEYGGLAGIVSREDIVEEILGELYDEHEQKEKERLHPTGPETWKIKGDVDFYEIQDQLNLVLPHDKRVLTISGYIIEALQEIPKEGRIIERPEGTYRILKMNENRIEEIELTVKSTKSDNLKS
jgi:CBS domain containing-hemolysin-like protein